MLARAVVGLLVACAHGAAGLLGIGVVTPVGPFCPFRSKACADNGYLGESMGALTEKMPAFATEMAKLQLSFTTGTPPDAAHVNRVADSLVEAEAEWQTMMARMRLAEDFQSREYFKMQAPARPRTADLSRARARPPPAGPRGRLTAAARRAGPPRGPSGRARASRRSAR